MTKHPYDISSACFEYNDSTPKETQHTLKISALATTMNLPLILDSKAIVYHSGHHILKPYFITKFSETYLPVQKLMQQH
jgi:hypothetical protein